MQIQRKTAHKLWISNIVNSPYTKSTGEFEPNYITLDNKQISRVNIIASVIETFMSEDEKFSSIVIDDGSATIKLQAFKEDTKLLKDFEMGDLIMAIGKVREFNNEKYILAEIVKTLNPTWGKIRRLELLKEIGEPPQVTQKIQQQPPQEIQSISISQIVTAPPSENSQKLLSEIRKSEEGMSIESLTQSLNLPQEEIEKTILELIKTNEIYQNKPGCYKVL